MSYIYLAVLPGVEFLKNFYTCPSVWKHRLFPPHKSIIFTAVLTTFSLSFYATMQATALNPRLSFAWRNQSTFMWNKNLSSEIWDGFSFLLFINDDSIHSHWKICIGIHFAYFTIPHQLQLERRQKHFSMEWNELEKTHLTKTKEVFIQLNEIEWVGVCDLHACLRVIGHTWKWMFHTFWASSGLLTWNKLKSVYVTSSRKSECQERKTMFAVFNKHCFPNSRISNVGLFLKPFSDIRNASFPSSIFLDMVC